MAVQESIVLGGGCFWCIEAGFRLISGVVDVFAGYAGGHAQNPNYSLLSSSDSGHAEVVKVIFEPDVIPLEDILDIFWALHDPTTLNYQGYDKGPQYRSIILFSGQAQETTVARSISKVDKLWDKPIVTVVEPLDIFYEAEEEHQNYFQKHPELGYCQVIINPKLSKLRQKFKSKLVESS